MQQFARAPTTKVEKCEHKERECKKIERIQKACALPKVSSQHKLYQN